MNIYWVVKVWVQIVTNTNWLAAIVWNIGDLATPRNSQIEMFFFFIIYRILQYAY